MQTDSVRTLVVGGGVSGLATAAFLKDRDFLVLEAKESLGGYCRTVKQDGFVWDYSGHFFHFRHPEIEAYLRERMPGQRVSTVQRRAFISYAGRKIDFPFQKNIHQLPQDEFIDCLHDLFFARAPGLGLGAIEAAKPETSFREMLYARFGRSIAEKFLIPYNEKLYACDLATLDPNAMGRFFPHAALADVIANMKAADNRSYNATFTYPEGGAEAYVHALASELPDAQVSLNEPLVGLDLERREARTPTRRLRYRHLVSSVPLPDLLRLSSVAHEAEVFSWNQVLVFNFGFDRKGDAAPHWVYFPDRGCSFYRVGYYDNIFDAPRMSLYVEVGLAKSAVVDVPKIRARVLEDLRKQGIVTDQQLVSEHPVLMNPAYVHITEASLREAARTRALLRRSGVHSIGRYGEWTYCSIEDNIVQARELTELLERTP